MVRPSALFVLLASVAVAAPRAPSWCLGMAGLGPIRAGMKVDDVLPLADWQGMERKTQPSDCWYLRYTGNGNDFQLMIIGGAVVRVELKAPSRLRTFSGAHIGSTEDELKTLYGKRLDIQPHKYDENGHTITVRSGSGEYGLRFETSAGKVTAIQSGPWEHLNYVEGCS